MLGRCKGQHSLFSAHGWPQRVPEESFYARLGAVCDEAVRGWRPGGHVSWPALRGPRGRAGALRARGRGVPDHGRPSWPPSLMSGILLLPYFEEVSDEEAVARLCFDMRWKVALQLPLAFVPPHPRPSVSGRPPVEDLFPWAHSALDQRAGGNGRSSSWTIRSRIASNPLCQKAASWM